MLNEQVHMLKMLRVEAGKRWHGKKKKKVTKDDDEDDDYDVTKGMLWLIFPHLNNLSCWRA